MYCLVTCNMISISISFEKNRELLLNEIQLIVADSSILEACSYFIQTSNNLPLSLTTHCTG